jgi:hypothetical protein
VTAVCFFILAYVFGALAYRYDLLPTWRFIQPVAQDVLAAGADWLTLFAVFLTLLPTLIELSSVGLVQRSIKALEYITYFFIFFDLVTDYTEAAALVESGSGPVCSIRCPRSSRARLWCWQRSVGRSRPRSHSSF